MRPQSLVSSLCLYGPIGVVLGLFHALLVSLVYSVLPSPYMDEMFHIRQTRLYCSGNFSCWDPMITTPPGLYLLALPLFCNCERYLNSLLIPFLFIAACRFRRMFCRSEVILSSLTIVALPVLLHSSLLFYTDCLSLLLVLLSFSFPPFLSSIFFALSLLVRQTNIIWAFLYASSYVFSLLDSRRPFSSLPRVLCSLFPFMLLGASFISFVIYNNGSIVLGDPSAHSPVLHIPQLLYFVLFSVCHSWPVVLCVLPSSFSSIFSRPFSSVILLTLISCSIHLFSFSHPYLLSDNRHIPFYVWRWFLSSPSVRLFLAPIYLISLSSLSTLSSFHSRFLSILFIVSTSLVLIPAHLLEFRYFIAPYVLFRLSLPPLPGRPSSIPFPVLLELFSNIAIFSFVFLLFLYKPFEWPSEPRVLQRFMW